MIWGRHKQDFQDLKAANDRLAETLKNLQDELHRLRITPSLDPAHDTVMTVRAPQSLLDELRARREELWNELEQHKNTLVELDAEIYWLETNQGAEKIIGMVIDHRNRANQVPRSANWKALGEEVGKKLKEFNAAD